jgi:hypothetical protein
MSSRNNQTSNNLMTYKSLAIKQQPKTNIFKLSNLEPVKSKFLVLNNPSSSRIFNPNKLPKEKPNGIRLINFDTIHNNPIYQEQFSESYITKTINYRKNPNNFTQISTIPGE